MLFETAETLNAISPISHGFFTRQGGVSRAHFSSLNCSFKGNDEAHLVQQNRQRCAQALGIFHQGLLIPNMVHGNRVIIVDKTCSSDQIANEEADAIITSSPGLAIGVTYADCLPILLSCVDGAVIAAIHAGWRGIRCEVIKHSIEAIKNHFHVADFVAAVGPAISQDLFVVRDEVFEFFMSTWPKFVVAERDCGRVDLKAIAVEQLLHAGVTTIELVGGYTDQDQEKYFSYRRDGGKTGGHIALIATSKR